MKTIHKKFAAALILLSIICFIPAFGQDDPPEKMPPHRNMADRWENLQSMKIAFITSELNLTPEEAGKFWPLYNEFESKRKEIAMNLIEDYRGEQPDLDRMSDAEADEMALNRMKEEKAIIELKMEYHEKYKEVLPVKKVLKFYEAEKKFKRNLLERLRDGRSRESREKYDYRRERER